MDYNNKYSSNNQINLQIASYYILFPIPSHEMLENVYHRDGLRKLNTSSCGLDIFGSGSTPSFFANRNWHEQYKQRSCVLLITGA
jgi:hypothetical protein